MRFSAQFIHEFKTNERLHKILVLLLIKFKSKN
jgi:hypothetical protein